MKLFISQLVTAVKSAASVATLKKALGLFISAFAVQFAALDTSHLTLQLVVSAALAAGHTAIAETWPVLRQIRASAKRADATSVSTGDGQ